MAGDLVALAAITVAVVAGAWRLAVVVTRMLRRRPAGHSPTDPACRYHRPPSSRLAWWWFDRHRGMACMACYAHHRCTASQRGTRCVLTAGHTWHDHISGWSDDAVTWEA